MATALGVLESTWEPLDGSDFHIRPLDGKDMLRVSDVVSFDKKGRTLISAEACVVLIRHGLIGWKNFADAEGNEVLFVTNQEENMTRLPFEIIRDLAMAILMKSSLGAEDQKN